MLKRVFSSFLLLTVNHICLANEDRSLDVSADVSISDLVKRANTTSDFDSRSENFKTCARYRNVDISKPVYFSKGVLCAEGSTICSTITLAQDQQFEPIVPIIDGVRIFSKAQTLELDKQYVENIGMGDRPGNKLSPADGVSVGDMDRYTRFVGVKNDGSSMQIVPSKQISVLRACLTAEYEAAKSLLNIDLSDVGGVDELATGFAKLVDRKINKMDASFLNESPVTFKVGEDQDVMFSFKNFTSVGRKKDKGNSISKNGAVLWDGEKIDGIVYKISFKRGVASIVKRD